nr:RDD family protein [Nocardia macrotermitis]
MIIVLIPGYLLYFLIQMTLGFSFGAQMVGGLLLGLVGALYFPVMEATQGFTLGKKILGLRTLGPNGAPKPDFQQALIRNIYAICNLVWCLGGIAALVIIIVMMVTIEQSPIKQGWHDRIAGGTQVIKG